MKRRLVNNNISHRNALQANKSSITIVAGLFYELLDN